MPNLSGVFFVNAFMRLEIKTGCETHLHKLDCEIRSFIVEIQTVEYFSVQIDSLVKIKTRSAKVLPKQPAIEMRFVNRINLPHNRSAKG